MKQLLSTREVAQFLDINEKMVYTLVADKGLPATKITGKWLFPLKLVEQWIETNTINYPEPTGQLPPYHGLLIITGSNDLLLDKTISLFNSLFPGINISRYLFSLMGRGDLNFSAVTRSKGSSFQPLSLRYFFKF